MTMKSLMKRMPMMMMKVSSSDAIFAVQLMCSNLVFYGLFYYYCHDCILLT